MKLSNCDDREYAHEVVPAGGSRPQPSTRPHARIIDAMRASISSCLVVATCAASASAYAVSGDATLSTPIDTATQSAFEMQRSGTNAGEPLAMSGDQASAAYARYLKSFDTAIPVFFGSSLKSDVSSAGGSQGSQ